MKTLFLMLIITFLIKPFQLSTVYFVLFLYFLAKSSILRIWLSVAGFLSVAAMSSYAIKSPSFFLNRYSNFSCGVLGTFSGLGGFGGFMGFVSFVFATILGVLATFGFLDSAIFLDSATFLGADLVIFLDSMAFALAITLVMDLDMGFGVDFFALFAALALGADFADLIVVYPLKFTLDFGADFLAFDFTLGFALLVGVFRISASTFLESTFFVLLAIFLSFLLYSADFLTFLSFLLIIFTFIK